MSEDFKYRGFLSYSHQNQAFGDWLHDRIERYKVPKDLVGTEGRHGNIPSKLNPIFRDRYDLEAGHSITEKISNALHDSAAMIVMCSPGAAKSEAVNEEIRMFKASGRENRIYPIIVEGSPKPGPDSCFPPMLRAVIGPDGQPTGETVEPIAADARDQGDGKDLAVLKVISGLLGVNLDDLRRREELARKKDLQRHRMAAALMGLMALAAIGGWIIAWKAKNYAVEQKQIAIEQREKADKQYEAALDQTLKLVISKASYETRLKGKSFQVSNVAMKGHDNSFLQFTNTDPRGSNYVFHRMTEILLDFAERPPYELAGFKLEKAWLEHAKLTLNNMLRRDKENEAMLETRAKVEKALANLD